MKKLREDIKGEIQKDGMVSKNAFRVSKKTKSLETEEDYEYTEDEDYDEDDAPIINIKFKRDTSSFYLSKQTRQGVLVQKIQMATMKKDEKKKRKASFEKGRMVSKNALRVSKSNS